MFRRRWATAKAKYNNLPESPSVTVLSEPMPPVASLESLASIPSIPITDASPIALVLTCNRSFYISRLIKYKHSWDYLEKAGYRVIFLYADNSIAEPVLKNISESRHSLTVPVPETYEYLTHKMFLAFKFISATFPASKGVLKVDDNDDIRDINCLFEHNELVKTYEYIGVASGTTKINTILTTGKDARFSSIYKNFNTTINKEFSNFAGPFYWLSNRLVQYLASNESFTYLPWEDMAVGFTLSKLPMPPSRFLAPWQTQNKITWEPNSEPVRKCTIELIGQLGNHMFQLAAILRHCKVNNMMPQLVLGNPRQISYYTTMLPRCKEFIVPRNRFVNRTTPFKYIPIAPTATELYGYLQSSKYFSDEKEYIKEMFTPEPSVQGICDLKYASLLALKDDTTVNVVVIHVRRGDYLNHPTTHGILTPKYFNNAIAEMSKRLENPQFLMFSDDTPYCRTTFTNTNLQVIDEPDPNMTFCLMKQFSNFILSNSTFSWWACYLSQKPGVVIVPDKWFGPTGDQDFEDIYEPGWIRIKAE